MSRLQLLFFIFFLIPTGIVAQNKIEIFDFDKGGELRTIYQQSIAINELYSTSFDGGSYLGFGTNIWTRLGFRGSIKRNLSYNTAIDLGLMYNHIKFENSTSQEYRPHQSFYYNFPVIGNSVIRHRFRLEERFRKTKHTDDQQFSSRLRYRISNKGRFDGQTVHPKAFYYNLSAEWNFNIYSENNKHFFQRGRYGLGYGYQFNTQFSFDATYFFEHNYVDTDSKHSITHIFHFALRHSIRLK